MSLTSSFISGAGIVGFPVTVYYQGIISIWASKKYLRILTIISSFNQESHTIWKFLFLVVAYALSTIITAHVFIPIFHGLKLSSSYEVLSSVLFISNYSFIINIFV